MALLALGMLLGYGSFFRHLAHGSHLRHHHDVHCSDELGQRTPDPSR